MPSVDARELFAPLGPSYDRVGAALSFGQDPRWRRFLVSRLPRDGGHVLDVATGTGLVAAELVRRGFRVTGVDQSPEMLASARRRFGDARRARRGVRRGAAVRRRLLRPPHGHVPPPLRRGPGRDAGRARARGTTGRCRRVARVRGPRRSRASCVGGLRASGPPPRGPCRSATAGARSATSSATRSARTGRRIRSSGSSSSGTLRASATSRCGA